MKKIIFCILFHIVIPLTISAAVQFDDPLFNAAVKLGRYSRGEVCTDTVDTSPLASAYGFLGKVITYKFTLPEDQDVAIHHWGSAMENPSKIYLYRFLEPRVEYEYIENEFKRIGMAHDQSFTLNGQEHKKDSEYYQTNYQTARDRYVQFCHEKGLPVPPIKDFQPFLFAEKLEKGTYYMVSEGYGMKYNSGYIYMEDGILSTTVMYGELSNPEAVKEEVDMGEYSASFSYRDMSRPAEYKEGAALHKFEITVPMDILISHLPSSTRTSACLQDDNHHIIATSADSPWPYIPKDSEERTTLYRQRLSPGVYHILSTSDDADEYVQLSVKGYVMKADDREVPLALTSQKSYVYTITPTVALSDVSGITLYQSIQKIVYYDGLGRQEQEISRGAGPGKQDLVSWQEYDAYGRNSVLWNPVPMGGSGQAYEPEDMAFHGAHAYQDACPKSVTTYELSPLDRVSAQYGAGEDWHENRRGVEMNYLTNVAGVDTLHVAHYILTDIGDTVITIAHNGFYATAQLSADRIQDEDGSVSFEFKNKLGQSVLTRQVLRGASGKEWYDTYYIYDDWGNLRVVLPPLAYDRLKSGSFRSDVNDALRDYAYLYQYDDRNRCIAKKLPGCDWTFYIYDKADRLIFFQDGNQREQGNWTFYISDPFGRTCLSGICKDTLSPFSNPLKGTVVKAERSSDLVEDDLYKGYVLSGVSLVSPVVLSVNYHDDYSFLGKYGFSDAGYETDAESDGFGKRYADSDKGLLTGTLTALLDESESPAYLYAVMYYDDRGRLIQSKSSNHLGGSDAEYWAYDFVGNPLRKKHIHTAMNNPAQVEYYAYTYDHAGRLLTVAQQLNDGAAVTLVSNSYDELGRLKSSGRNGVAALRSDYSYTVRSWVKRISGALFHQQLYYNDKRDNGTNRSLYNGNISGMDWQAADDKNRGYDFSYDGLSRLTGASYQEEHTASDKFTASYSYDKHGNILRLSRHGNTDANTYGLVDDLTLAYDGNRLICSKNSGTIEYGYDANGNQTKDLTKGITGIAYNVLNLPQSIYMNGMDTPVSKYVYSASGHKLSVIHQSPAEKRTDYAGNMIYENGVLKRILVDGGYIEDGEYYFYLQDHLGSNRVVAKADGTVVQTNHYYPFGMPFAESTSPDKQPYKYNGKELDTENGLNLYDYDARQMEAALGRFTSIDPLAEKYYSISPYVYCGDNPMRFIDPNGKDPIYAKKIWGRVKLIGDDGKNSTGSYLVKGSVAKEVKTATKAGKYYAGDLSENKEVMHIPTGQKLEGVKQSYEDTKLSQKENGGHSNIGDIGITRWDEGPIAITFTDKNGNQVAKASLQMFVVDGTNTTPADASNIEMWWHTHPNTTVGDVSLGNSIPSNADYQGQENMMNKGYKGNSFIIGVRTGTVTFFDKDNVLITVKWNDFLKMGGQCK